MTDVVDENLDPKTFDLGVELSGIKRVERRVPVYLDEELALELADIEAELEKISVISDIEKVEAYEAERDRLRTELNESAYTFVLRSTTRKVRKDIAKLAYDKFPEVKTALGLPEENTDRENYFVGLLWDAHVVEIISPSGAVSRPTPENLQQFRDQAPDYSSTLVQDGIDKLIDNSARGLKSAQSVHFLSRTSPEA